MLVIFVDVLYRQLLFKLE